MYKKGDKVIILDYNGKPAIPKVVAEIEDVYGEDRVRLHLPDNACCLEFTDRFEKIDDDTYDEILHAVQEREKEMPVDLQLDIRKFASKHPRRRKDEIIKMFNDNASKYHRDDCPDMKAYKIGRVSYAEGKAETQKEKVLFED